MTAWNEDLDTQIRTLRAILRQSTPIERVLSHAARLGMPDWYLGAGCLAQTV